MENSVFLTVVQAVGTAARFRQIWHKAHGQVRKFRKSGQEENPDTQRRGGLEFLADDLGNLELDLSFSVDASAGLGLLIPALRIESEAHFGINATEVHNDWSIFDIHHYRHVYVTAACLALVPLIAFLILNGRAWLTSRQEKKERQKQSKTAAGTVRQDRRSVTDIRVRGRQAPAPINVMPPTPGH